jgi:hypothetical protein
MRCAALRALVRANATEQVCLQHDGLRPYSGNAFLMGLLTELPALTGLPATQLAHQLRLPQEAARWLRQRLQGDRQHDFDVPYAALGSWVDGSERIDTASILDQQATCITALGVEPASADSVLLDALLHSWTQAGLSGPDRFS